MRKDKKQLGLETLERREFFSANSLAIAGNLETDSNIGMPSTSFENQAGWHGNFQAGKFTGWLDDFRNSETFASFDEGSALPTSSANLESKSIFSDGFESGDLASSFFTVKTTEGTTKHEVREHVQFLSADRVDAILASPDVY